MHLEPENIPDLFHNGMKRHLVRYLPVPPGGIVLNLGSGNSPIQGAVNLDRGSDRKSLSYGRSEPGEFAWEAPRLSRWYDEGSVSAVHAYHFFEHLTSDDLRVMMSEVSRVLKPKGVLWYCVPYALSPIAFMDADHKTFWTEETMRTLLESRGYASAATERLKIQFQFIAGITSQNLAVLGALQKLGTEV